MIHGDDDMHDAEKCRKYQKNKSRGIFFTFFPPHTFSPMTNVLCTTLREQNCYDFKEWKMGN